MAQSWFFNLQRVRASSVRPFWKSDTVAFSMSALGNRFQIRISPKIDLSISLWCVPKRLSTSWHLCLFCWRRVGTPVVMTSRGNNPFRSLCVFPCQKSTVRADIKSVEKALLHLFQRLEGSGVRVVESPHVKFQQP